MSKSKTLAVPEENPEGSTAPQPAVVLERHILATLGRPPYLLRISVNRLWGNTYRANVLVGESFGQARCAHSYFLEATEAGAVVSSTPALIRVYT